jgi:hypothetical protein
VATLSFGRSGDRYLAGDWDGDGDFIPGVLRSGSRWYLKDSLSGGAASVGLKKETPGTPGGRRLGQPALGRHGNGQAGPTDCINASRRRTRDASRGPPATI